MLHTDEIAVVVKFLEEGGWHQEQHLVQRFARETGVSEDTAFAAVIRVWHAIEDRIERRLDMEVMDFQWRLSR